ncbi:hypothetical protein JOE31_001291 [Arthrobacter sp. PvP023]|uniref:hypothetical protein n=1 Tax=Micrococcaceae TaxID=1268 RepID=UPI001AEA8968|nr:hypothetical protein [Arthrobacter sp. PvP023]MBP1135059.1 hypothetical protein [Arthrobacter sp. PvP023]
MSNEIPESSFKQILLVPEGPPEAVWDRAMDAAFAAAEPDSGQDDSADNSAVDPASAYTDVDIDTDDDSDGESGAGLLQSGGNTPSDPQHEDLSGAAGWDDDDDPLGYDDAAGY